MIDLLPLLGYWGLLALVMGALWLLQKRTGDAGVVDLAWGCGLALGALGAALLGSGDPLRRVLLGLLCGLPAARLAWYVLTDRILPGEEDGRYAALRQSWAPRFQTLLFWFFQAQALAVALLTGVFMIAAANSDASLSAWDIAAVLLWTIAASGEAVADRQLQRFRRDPANRGRTCRRGLWRYSRHPNYFFQWLLWFVPALLAIGHPLAPLAWVAPALMLTLILKVTGIPPTEAQALRSRGDDYRAYQRSTSALIPWFPRRRTT
jgi:steroid 5-alpha reductase family enzyme